MFRVIGSFKPPDSLRSRRKLQPDNGLPESKEEGAGEDEQEHGHATSQGSAGHSPNRLNTINTATISTEGQKAGTARSVHKNHARQRHSERDAFG